MREALVLGELDDWRTGLAEANVPIVGTERGKADFVVTTGRRLEEALATGADLLLVEGRPSRRRLADRGYAVERFLPVPSTTSPELLVPLERPGPARYALEHLAAPAQRWKELRNRLLRVLLERGRFPPVRPLVAVAARKPRPPFLVAAAQAKFGLPRELDWLLSAGGGDPLARGVFHLFPAGSSSPSWALKFARVPHYSDPFDRDERGLTLARGAGDVVTAHAPRLLGRLETEALHASLETAAVGRRLIAFLHSRATRSEKETVLERIAAWIVELARATAAPASALEQERKRLVEEVLPRWEALPVPADLVERIPPLPAVLLHNDLGSWNIVVGTDGFRALDWESARAHGFPLWDLWYFLADGFAHLDGASTLEAQESHFVQLFSGELPSSRSLFRWTQRAAVASAVPPDAVGAVATLCWLHHGLSHVARARALERHTRADRPPIFMSERWPHLWFNAPLLGPDWSSWRDA